jgi:hypothetical protein
MNEFLPGRKVFHNWSDGIGGSVPRRSQQWERDELNWKAYVVCEPCNNGWMSNIEKWRAKPAMEDLIIGKGLDFTIGQSRANDIAIFSFKTAVILDHLVEGRERFFARSVRHNFRRTLEIPPHVRMWFAGYFYRTAGRATSFYYGLPGSEKLELYVLNYYVGHFVIQLVVQSELFLRHISPDKRYEGIAVPFWPRIPDSFSWPPPNIIFPERNLMNSLLAGRICKFGSFSRRAKRRNRAPRFFPPFVDDPSATASGCQYRTRYLCQRGIVK